MPSPLAPRPIDARTTMLRSRPGESAWELWRRQPHPALREIVRGLWAGGTAAPCARHRVLPNGELTLMIHVGPAQRAIESDGKRESRLLGAGFVAGLQQRPYTIESLHRDTYVVVARIRPECAAALFPITTPAELVGQLEDARDLLGRSPAEELSGRLREAADLGEALELLEAWLLERARPERLPRALTRVASERVTGAAGNLRVSALSKELGVSARRINEIFQSEVGVQVKRVAKIARFRGTLDRISSERRGDLARIAQDAGYYDESHLYRDFRELALLTPTEYVDALGDGLDGADVIAG